MKTGINLTSSNHHDTEMENGFLLSVLRSYSLGRHTELRGEAGYSLRRFSLPAQTFLYASLGGYRKFFGEVNFSVGYFDTSLLFSYRNRLHQHFFYNVSTGPSLSVVVTTRRHTIFRVWRKTRNPVSNMILSMWGKSRRKRGSIPVGIWPPESALRTG